MNKEWFVIHTMTGHEAKVKDSIEKRLKLAEMEDLIDEVIIPMEKVTEVKHGVRSTTNRKFFPGYVLVHMALYGEQRAMIERAWHFIKETAGVIGFVGGNRPMPLRPEEVDQVMHQVEEKQEKAAPKVVFEPGETIKIIDGPFLNFDGVVKDVDPERGKMTVDVAIFGGMRPVELEYWQVERA